ncbi:unnamed protein product [Rotaria socialis]|uniref:Uncharacterized protein n=1 Tax=Rotaria socialis TaxID=392032 RepID=A0A820T436_9BILA|nr:unnamed protein product [Rotaria socialis]CAF4460060.1 unnamed protein product [Rotaria socialis]
MGNFVKDKRYFEKRLHFSTDKLQRWFACVCLINYYYTESEYGLPIKYATHADGLKQTIDNVTNLSSMLVTLAVYISQTEHKLSDDICKEDPSNHSLSCLASETCVASSIMYVNMGQYCMKINDYSSAIDNYNICLSLAKKHLPANHQLAAVIHQCLAEAHGKLHHYETTINHLSKALAILNRILLEEIKQYNVALLDFTLGLLYFETRDYDLSLVNFKKSLNIHTTKSMLNSTMVSDLHQYVATCYQLKNLYDLAIKHYINVFEEYDDSFHLDSNRIVDIYYQLGRCNYYKSDFDYSLQYYYKSLQPYELCSTSANTVQLTRLDQSISNVYDIKGDFKLALKHCREALVLQDPNDESATASLYNSLGHFLNDQYGYACLLNSFAPIYYKLDDDSSRAYDYCKKSMKLLEQCGEAQSFENFELLANIYFDRSQHTLPFNCYIEALKLIKNTQPLRAYDLTCVQQLLFAMFKLKYKNICYAFILKYF